MHKTNIGVFFGGKSPEHDVSIITGEFIISELKKMGYEVTPVYLDKDGSWHINKNLGALKFFQKKNKKEYLKKFEKFYLDLEKSKNKIVFKKKGLIKKEISINLAFPAFHGSNGEDGAIQGFFEIFNMPYVGCDVASSALAIDKVLTKLFYKSHNILTADFIYFDKIEWREKKESILKIAEEKLKYPLFIKPPKLGSSIGISKAKNKRELEFGIEVALHYGNAVLIEEGVENLVDITCAVLGNKNSVASLIQESNFGGEFFNYEEKYLRDGGAQTGRAEKNIIIPARLDDATTEAVQKMALRIFSIFGCSGIARVDFLYNKETKKIYANEVNTLPGTLYHHLWEASGIKFNELLSRLIILAREKYNEKREISHTFDSDILKMASSIKLKK
jgi:D-alanine-D-alanine ligase